MLKLIQLFTSAWINKDTERKGKKKNTSSCSLQNIHQTKNKTKKTKKNKKTTKKNKKNSHTNIYKITVLVLAYFLFFNKSSCIIIKSCQEPETLSVGNFFK